VASVSLENVSKTYVARRGSHCAVDGLTLKAENGEQLVLVGPSGCGKTTTLRLIAGVEDPTSGVIRIADRDVCRAAPRDRDVAMVFQGYALYPHMTVFNNLAFGLKMRKTPKPEIHRRVAETASMLKLETLLNRKPWSLSGGERQRVALGRAIVRRPRVFLLDEPLAGLDAALRHRLRAELKVLHTTLGVTMIHVTHDQEEAMSIADRIVVMNRGAVQQYGTPMEVFDRPINRFVAEFIGTPRMNLLEAEVEQSGVHCVCRCAIGTVPLKFNGENFSLRAHRHEKAILLGIRPTDISLQRQRGSVRPPGSRENGNHAHNLELMNVVLVEPLGDRMDVHLQSPREVRLLARVPVDPSIAPGMSVRPVFDLARMHLFCNDARGDRLNDLAGP